MEEIILKEKKEVCMKCEFLKDVSKKGEHYSYNVITFYSVENPKIFISWKDFKSCCPFNYDIIVDINNDSRIDLEKYMFCGYQIPYDKRFTFNVFIDKLNNSKE